MTSLHTIRHTQIFLKKNTRCCCRYGSALGWTNVRTSSFSGRRGLFSFLSWMRADARVFFYHSTLRTAPCLTIHRIFVGAYTYVFPIHRFRAPHLDHGLDSVGDGLCAATNNNKVDRAASAFAIYYVQPSFLSSPFQFGTLKQIR